MSLQAYEKTQRQSESSRDVEYRLFGQVTQRNNVFRYLKKFVIQELIQQRPHLLRTRTIFYFYAKFIRQFF